MAAKQRGRVVKVRRVRTSAGRTVSTVTIAPEALAASGIEEGEYVMAVVDAKRKGVIELHRVGTSATRGGGGSTAAGGGA